jgi:hypothetical protein
LDSKEVKKILYGLANEIRYMTEEEKILSLKKIVQAEKQESKNNFWTKVAKKMLIDEDFNEKVFRKLGVSIH